jgi:SSS family solute:Na+ symporter
MGGLRAVVMTDAVQSIILFGGAILTLVLVTSKMGGVGQWWPQHWSPQWDELKFFYDPNARLTILGAMTASFCWHVSTAGSDQMAIQRYLATPSVKTARRVVAIYLVADVLVGIFLATIGLALFAFFTKNPEMLPAGQTVQTNSDTLFPRFIVTVLPPGITGLVIAGLLAAAMSSLSSGVNSSSAVIAVDFIDRFRRRAPLNEQQNLRRTKIISWTIGVVVVMLSIVVSRAGGNLLENCHKIVNLLTAPLFVLFFMAFFVPWSTSFGAFTAGVASAVMAIGVGHLQWWGLSFIWVLPSALITGLVVGPIVSLVPIGRRARPLEARADDAG